MPQISKRFVKPAVKEKIDNLFIECIAECRNQNEAANFINVLLTKTEKTVIAKRVAIALMLTKGYTATDIDEKLKVSLATVYTVKYWLEEKGSEINAILTKIAKRDQRQELDNQEFQREADSLFPPPPGTNWRNYRRFQNEKILKTSAPF
ncbi:hypothetical protein HYU89_04095 [Candidatus Collierbacteria bacterium]|nr:hypothetical protein [Candidatus Collierbacteria bacterium]